MFGKYFRKLKDHPVLSSFLVVMALQCSSVFATDPEIVTVVDASIAPKPVSLVVPQVRSVFTLQTDGNATAGVLQDEVVISKSNNETTADLALQTVSIDPGPYLPGEEISIFTDVENIGLEASTTYRMDFYVSTDTTITSSDRSLGYFPSLPALDTGEFSSFYAITAIPGNLALGQYYIGAILTLVDADDTNHVNHDPGVITVSMDPDMLVRPLSLSFEELPANPLAATPSVTTLKARSEAKMVTMSFLQAEAKRDGKVRVIVGLDSAFQAKGLDTAVAASQRATIETKQGQLMTSLSGFDVTENARYAHIPFIALTVDEAALLELYRSSQVVSIELDAISRPHMVSSNNVIGSPLAWAEGYDGSGWAVAVLDTGVDKTHSWFSTDGKVVSEACYSSNYVDVSSLCPGGVTASTASGSGVDCGVIDGCDHGTHVAGTVAGNDGIGPGFGVARGADIIAMQVFSQFNDSGDCSPDPAPCVLSYSSDQISALERVLDLTATMDIASVNMSLGGGKYSDQTSCDNSNSGVKAAADLLRTAGVATVISAGNDGYTDSIGAPGCVSTAISVGATTDDDAVASFSNVYPFLHLLAPGVSIVSSVPGESTASFQGTSMSAPHVAGAWAVLMQNSPTATVSETLTSLQSTATLVSDQRSGGIETDMPRINLDMALGSGRTTFGIFNDGPGILSISSIAPDSAADWISWDPPAPFDVPADGLQVVSVSIDYDQAPSGTTLRRLLISSNDPDSSPYPGGVDVSVTTTVVPSPDVPANVSASDGTFTDKVRVNWDNVTGEDEFQVFRCTTSSEGSCSQIATPAANTTQYDDTGANADGTVHYYRVKACSVAGGCSAYSDADGGNRQASASTYSIGGNVSGLAGSGLVLQNNGGDNKAISAEGNFVFGSELTAGSSYNVTVETQPTNLSQTCNVTNGSGTMPNANVTNVQVTCTTNTFSIGGDVSGLLGTGLVLLNNGGDDETIAADGDFEFDAELTDGSGYAVTVKTQPTNPGQKCEVSNGGGTLAGADIANVAVTCEVTCNVNMVPGGTEDSDAIHEACDILALGPGYIVGSDVDVSVSSGWEIDFLPGFIVESGATLNANVCGQSLCIDSLSPMLDGCHTCVTDICAIDAACCETAWDQDCVDQVESVCGLLCE